MAEQQMECRSKGVSSDEINNLSDNEYKKLLDEAFSIKTIKPDNKSPLLRTLLSENAIDDDDFPSNVREMIDAMKEPSCISNKKTRTNERRRAKEENQQQKQNSIASRSIQGGSLQNLSGCDMRKIAVGEGRGRGQLYKSGSVNSFISAREEKLRTRSSNHMVSESEFSDTEMSKKFSSPLVRDVSAKKPLCFNSKLRRKSMSACGDCISSPPQFDETSGRKIAIGQEIEMMEIDHSDDDANHCNSYKSPIEVQVDDGIYLPIKLSAEEYDYTCLKVDDNTDGSCNSVAVHDLSEFKDRDYENTTKVSSQTQNKRKKSAKTSELTIFNEFSPDKINTTHPEQLDVNGNPVVDQMRNSSIRSSNRTIETNDSESSNEVEKRRKHKRNKPSNTLIEMRAGDVQGNRGLDPLELLVEFINSSDKKRHATTIKTTSQAGLGLKNNKTKKQEKENNKRNLPPRNLADPSTDYCMKNVNGSIFDLLQIETNKRKMSETVDLSEQMNGMVKIQTVRKAHSWEGTKLAEKAMHVNCDLMEVSSDGGIVFVPRFGNNTCEPSVISGFVTDFYEDSDVTQLMEEPEFRIVIPKRQRRYNRDISRINDDRPGTERGNRDFQYSRSVNGDGNFSEKMMLLARLPMSRRSGTADSRRKSTSSMPPSDHSSVDNSDLDSVHSLPVKSTTTKLAIAKTSSSSSNTPQASYADITKMSTNSASSSSNNLTPVAPATAAKFHSVGAFGLSTKQEMQFLRPINKKDASTCTTDDIPGEKKKAVTHWSSYPILSEATGKNDASPVGTGTGAGSIVSNKGDNGDGVSGCPSDESKRDDTNSSGLSFSPSELVESGVNSSHREAKVTDYSSGENLPTGCASDNRKEEEDIDSKQVDESALNLRSSTSIHKTLSAVTMPTKLVTKKRREVACSSATTNSNLSESLDSKSLKTNRKGVARNTPAVVIMNKYKGESCTLNVSFGFEVNEQLLRKDAVESVMPVGAKCEETVLGLQETVTSCPELAVEVSSASSCSSDSISRASATADDGGFNFSNVVDYINRSWDNVVKEYKNEKSSTLRRIKYLNDQ